MKPIIKPIKRPRAMSYLLPGNFDHMHIPGIKLQTDLIMEIPQSTR
jgi:hypothetical protein